MNKVVLIELCVLPTQVLAFIIKADQTVPRVARINHPESDLQNWVRQLLTTLHGKASATAPLAYLADLLAAIEQETEHGDVLYFVPHGPLHQIPFHALPLMEQPLIRRNPVVYAPSASVLAQTARRKQDRSITDAIVVGDTRSNLPYAHNEANLVADLLGTQPIMGRGATRAAILDALAARGDARAVHMACHGYFDTHNAMASGIVTANDDADTGEFAVLRAQDFLDRTVNVDLITFSACESGMSIRHSGDELMGLPRALLVAGASSVLASMWKVDDLSTSILMVQFYTAWLKDGLSKAHALQQAQCHVMDLKEHELKHIYETRASYLPTRDLVPVPPSGHSTASSIPLSSPYHWASFNLIGNWR